MLWGTMLCSIIHEQMKTQSTMRMQINKYKQYEYAQYITIYSIVSLSLSSISVTVIVHRPLLVWDHPKETFPVQHQLETVSLQWAET